MMGTSHNTNQRWTRDYKQNLRFLLNYISRSRERFGYAGVRYGHSYLRNHYRVAFSGANLASCEVHWANLGLPIYSLLYKSNRASEKNRFVSNEWKKRDDMNESFHRGKHEQ